MNSNTSTDTKKEISLLDSLDEEWIKLPLAVMRDVGPAAQTLGGILKITDKETFTCVRSVAEKSRLPFETARKHLVTLQDHGWIENVGRGHTRTGRARRTCTIKLTAKTKNTLGEYAFLPWWTCGLQVGFFPWSSKAVLSLVMARLAAMKAAIERQDGTGLDAEDFWGSLDNMGGDDRFRFSLDRLHRETGLFRSAIVIAKRRLAALKIIEWTAGGDGGDLLFPNADFRLAVTTKSDGGCNFKFTAVRGAEGGQ